MNAGGYITVAAAVTTVLAFLLLSAIERQLF